MRKRALRRPQSKAGLRPRSESESEGLREKESGSRLQKPTARKQPSLPKRGQVQSSGPQDQANDNLADRPRQAHAMPELAANLARDEDYREERKKVREVWSHDDPFGKYCLPAMIFSTLPRLSIKHDAVKR